MIDEIALEKKNDAPYVFACTDCKTSDWTHRDFIITRAIRRGEAACADCGGKLTMVRDKQETRR